MYVPTACHKKGALGEPQVGSAGATDTPGRVGWPAELFAHLHERRVLASAAGQPVEPTRQLLGPSERVALGVFANGVGCHQVVQPVVRGDGTSG